jgi:hypothetical protein
MTPLSRIRLVGLAGAGALAALTAAGAPAHADDPLTNLGPVGPREPILLKIGNQRIIAFFIPERGECGVNAVTWKDADANAPYASVRVRVSLKPGQLVQLDGSRRQSMSLLCGADASSLAVTAPPELLLTGASDSGRN